MHFKRIDLIYRDTSIQYHLLVNFISKAPYPWWPTIQSRDCQEHSESGKVRSHLEREGGSSQLDPLPSPVGNACCRDGFWASGYNCQRIVLKVVVPGFSGEIFLVQGTASILPHQFHHGLFIHHFNMVPCHDQSTRCLVIGEPAPMSENNLLLIDAPSVLQLLILILHLLIEA